MFWLNVGAIQSSNIEFLVILSGSRNREISRSGAKRGYDLMPQKFLTPSIKSTLVDKTVKAIFAIAAL